MKMITVEEHFMSFGVNREYSRIMSQTASPAARARLNMLENFLATNERISDIGALRLAFMDKSGIDLQVLSYGNNNPAGLPAEAAIPLCRQANNELAEHIGEHKARFAGLACLPVADAVAAADELSRAVNELGFKGAILAGTYQDSFFDEPGFFPVFAKAAELNVPISLHPGFISEKVEEYYFKSSQWPDTVGAAFSAHGYGWHMDIGIHMMRLILSGLFDKLPGLKILAGHWGELVPYYFDRIDETLPPSITRLERKFSEYYKEHVYVTPSGMFHSAPARLAIAEMGADHVVWATDYPYVMKENTREFLIDMHLSDVDTEKIAHLNAEKLFRL